MERWKLAQDAEKKFWERIQREGYENIPASELKEYHKRGRIAELYLDGFDMRDFDNKVVIEVGCGPYGFIEWLNNTRMNIGTDPLIKFFYQKYGLNPKNAYVKGVAEYLPFRSECADFIFCHNMLDHTSDPIKVLKEMNRILNSKGFLILHNTVHSFLFSIIRRIQEKIPSKICEVFIHHSKVHTEHPFSFTASALLKMITSNHFEVIRGRLNVPLEMKERNKIKKLVNSFFGIKDHREAKLEVVARKKHKY
jgi:ubiquinone/menaquinone biosynthesis C-methylase UbiE